MILAAGLGTRMRPLTNTKPKPLIPLLGKPLIEYQLERCLAAGIREFVINVSYLGHMIEQYLGNGERWDAVIEYSREPEPLDVAGGLRHALPLLGDDPFWCLSADVYSDFTLPKFEALPHQGTLGHLVMVPNPEHHPRGDFALQEGTGAPCLFSQSGPKSTYSGMALLSPELLSIAGDDENRFAPILTAAITQHLLTGQIYTGVWSDVGTPERLAELESQLKLQGQASP